MSQIVILLFYFLTLYSIIEYGRIITLFNSNYQVSLFDGLQGIALLISIHLSRLKFNLLKSKKKKFFILLLNLLIFITLNILRINKEFKQYGYNRIKGAFFYINKNCFTINDKVEKLYKNHKIKDKVF